MKLTRPQRIFIEASRNSLEAIQSQGECSKLLPEVSKKICEMPFPHRGDKKAIIETFYQAELVVLSREKRDFSGGGRPVLQ
jgi:hypothetical protein